MTLSRRALLLASGAMPFAAKAAGQDRVICPLQAEPAVLVPGVSNTLETRLMGSKIYGGLCRFDARGVPQPELAAGWEVSPDGLTYTFHLRPGLAWHDSGGVTADDVVFSLTRFHRQLQPHLGLGRVVAAKAPDPHTAVITLGTPFEPFLRQMDARSAPIVPQHVHDRPGFALDPRQTTPVGTGPFRMAEWLHLVRFDWFAGPKPLLAGIDFPVGPAPTAPEQPGLLLVGDVVDPRRLAQFRQAATLAVGMEPAGTIAGIRLNPAAKPLDDLQVRLGLTCAIDRAVVLRDVWRGLAREAVGPVLSGSPDRNPAAMMPPYDPRTASLYFTQAGLRPDDDGIRLRLSHLVPPDEPWPALAASLRAMLALVGVDLVLEEVTAPDWTRRVAAGAYQSTGFLAGQTGDPMLDLAPYAAEAPAIAPLLVGEGSLAEAQVMLVKNAARVWLVEPGLPVVRDRRLHLPGGVFGTFATAGME